LQPNSLTNRTGNYFGGTGNFGAGTGILLAKKRNRRRMRFSVHTGMTFPGRHDDELSDDGRQTQQDGMNCPMMQGQSGSADSPGSSRQ
jgi:hypothetical protein